MAATLTDGNDLTYASFPIEKWEDGPDGSVYVYGKATTPEVDTDEQICDTQWSAAAIKTWADEAPALRVNHQAQRDPAGSGIHVELNRDGDGAHWVKSIVDEPVAVRLVKKGHLRAYSIGIAKPVIERDVTGKARGGIIKGGQIAEISLVDSPANRSCFLEMVKADKNGDAEWSGKVFGAGDFLAKDAEPDLIKGTVTFSPSDLEKLLQHRKVAEDAQATKAAAGADEAGGDNAEDDEKDEPAQPDMKDDNPADDDDSGKGAEPDAAEVAVADAVKAVEVAVYKRDIDAATRKRLASEGRALPDGSYPIETQEDMHNAWTLAKSKHGDWQAALRLIAKVAKEEGWTPPGDAEKAAAADDAPAGEAVKAAKPKMACPSCGKKSGARNPFCFKCGKKMTPDKADAAGKAASPSPADGVKDADPTEPVSPHREPDGVAMELLEDDAHLEGGNPDQHSEMAAEAAVAPPAAEDAELGKTGGSEAASWRIRQAGASWGEGLLHDFLCPAFSPDATEKSYPGQTVTAVADPAEWQSKALSAAIDAPLDEAGKAQRRWQDALTIAGTDAETLTGLRWEAHKAFADANPGPATYPTPGELRPQSFRRPALSGADQSATTAASGASPSAITAEHISATDFQRGPLTGGQEASSEPEGDNGSQGVPAVPGRPQRTFYRNTSRDGARSAMASMHDHIAQTFPDLCSMHAPGHGGQPPAGARPVPVPGTRKGADGGGEAEGATLTVTPETAYSGTVGAEVTKAAMKPAKMDCKCGKKARPGKFCGGCGEKMPMKGGGMAAKAADPLPAVAALPVPSLDAAALEAAIGKAIAPLAAKLQEQGELIDQMASAPDPRYAPFKAVAAGGVLPKALQPAPPAAPQQDVVAKAASNVQETLLRDLQYQARNDPDPGKREVAWAALTEMLHMPGTSALPR